MIVDIKWIRPGEEVSIIGPFGKVDAEVLAYHDVFVSLRIKPSTELPSPSEMKKLLDKKCGLG